MGTSEPWVTGFPRAAPAGNRVRVIAAGTRGFPRRCRWDGRGRQVLALGARPSSLPFLLLPLPSLKPLAQTMTTVSWDKMATNSVLSGGRHAPLTVRFLSGCQSAASSSSHIYWVTTMYSGGSRPRDTTASEADAFPAHRVPIPGGRQGTHGWQPVVCGEQKTNMVT